jgi:hypothetical protein
MIHAQIPTLALHIMAQFCPPKVILRKEKLSGIRISRANAGQPIALWACDGYIGAKMTFSHAEAWADFDGFSDSIPALPFIKEWKTGMTTVSWVTQARCELTTITPKEKETKECQHWGDLPDIETILFAEDAPDTMERFTFNPALMARFCKIKQIKELTLRSSRQWNACYFSAIFHDDKSFLCDTGLDIVLMPIGGY